ncbi:SET domain-containing protein [Candidatus Uhrbacteria bacterium]|nr:SET domain-containing protein [Candidatus Uhrbacteria bacterium]
MKDLQRNEKLIIDKNIPNPGIFAIVPIVRGEIIFYFDRHFVATPTNISMRVDEHRHQLSTDPTLPENFLNHSCAPTSFVDFEILALKALRDILPGEQITYNYYTSDWDDEDVFECHCGASDCHRYIRGFKNLPIEQRLKIKDFLSPFLLSKFYDGLSKDQKICHPGRRSVWGPALGGDLTKI